MPFDACDRARSAIQPNTRKAIKYKSRGAILRPCRNRTTRHSEALRGSPDCSITLL